MKIADLRVGNYVFAIIKDMNSKIHCEILEISTQKCTVKDLENGKIFSIDIEQTEGIPMTEDQLTKFGFKYEEDKQVYGLIQKGAWVKDGIMIQYYKGNGGLLKAKSMAFYGCKKILIPYVHLFQNAVLDNFNLDLKYV
jgi:hypothetical protein